MRMWMINPKLLCRQHLLGEHVEIHKLVGCLLKGRSIKGFLDKDLLVPQEVYNRHEALAKEMIKRGYYHRSDLPKIDLSTVPKGKVDIEKSYADLFSRCCKCRLIILNFKKDYKAKCL